MKPADHDRVKDDVGDSSDHAADHRLAARTFGADHEACGCGPDDERCAVGNVEDISFCEIISFRIRAEDPEDRLHEQDQQGGKDNADAERSVCNEGGDLFHPLFIVFAHRDGSRGASAHAEHVGKGHKQDKDRVRQADGSDLQRIAGLPDEEGVRHVVDDGDQAADDARDRHFGDSLRDGHGFHEFVIVHDDCFSS